MQDQPATIVNIVTAKSKQAARSATQLSISWDCEIDALVRMATRHIVIATQAMLRRSDDVIPATLAVKASDFVPGHRNGLVVDRVADIKAALIAGELTQEEAEAQVLELLS